MRNVKIAIYISCLFLMSTSCKTKEIQHSPGVSYYFGGFATYYKPFIPEEPLQYDEAVKREAYYVAYYNEKGQLQSFTKYLYGKLEFSVKYYYRASGIIEREDYHKSNGEVGSWYYDDKGNIIKK